MNRKFGTPSRNTRYLFVHIIKLKLRFHGVDLEPPVTLCDMMQEPDFFLELFTQIYTTAILSLYKILSVKAVTLKNSNS